MSESDNTDQHTEILQKAGDLIDRALYTQNKHDTDQAFLLLAELEEKNPAPEIATLVHYFRANAWANRNAENPQRKEWAWEQIEAQEQIFELRKAANHLGFQKLRNMQKTQILTNLANQLSFVGRFIEASYWYDQALSYEHLYAKTLAGKAINSTRYALSLYDGNDQHLLLIESYQNLLKATSKNSIYEPLDSVETNIAVNKHKAELESILGNDTISELPDLNTYYLGRSKSEREYRKWCLSQNLFLNPLNDLGPYSIAAIDSLVLPPFTTSISDKASLIPDIVGFFNQLKQEFVSARYLVHEGLQAVEKEGHPHFSDREVLLLNTLDYPAYGLGVEKIRITYRIAYSLFDKISYFLNFYLQLGIPAKSVNFRNVWYDQKTKKLLAQFSEHQNQPLKGLFWLSKDLFDTNFQKVMEPEAKELADIRNYLEHKYLSLHYHWPPHGLQPGAVEKDFLVYQLSDSDFAKKTIHVLKQARSALIYLSLAIHSEENLRNAGKEKGIIVQSPLFNLNNKKK